MGREGLSREEAQALYEKVGAAWRYFARLKKRAEARGMPYEKDSTGCFLYLVEEVEKRLHALMTHLYYASCFTSDEICQRRRQGTLPLDFGATRSRPVLTVVTRHKKKK